MAKEVSFLRETSRTAASHARALFQPGECFRNGRTRAKHLETGLFKRVDNFLSDEKFVFDDKDTGCH